MSGAPAGGGPGGRRILLGVGGGAACFKAVALASRLTAGGFAVRVLLTAAAEAFVRPLSFQAVTGGVVVTSSLALDPDGRAAHIAAKDAALLIVAPATADLIGRLAAGLADDAVTLAALAFEGPRLFCPAMNDAMWEAAPVRRNVKRLEADGWRRLGPVRGRLAEGYEAAGRMVEPDAILAEIQGILAGRKA